MDGSTWLSFVGARLPELWLRIGQHLVLTGVSTAAAILIGVPVGAVAAQVKWLRGPIVGTAGILQTIPSLAMLTLLLAAMQKIGAWPAIVALTLYALLPIVRNTMAGVRGVSPEVMEAARGIGMTRWQQMWSVRLPLALPVLIAGVRTAAVAGVGIATLSAFIGAGGLGQFINRGLALADTRLILLGAVPAALLALLVDFALGGVKWALDPRRRRRFGGRSRMLLQGSAMTLPLILCAAGGFGYIGNRPDVAIGSKNFTEQILLGHMMAELIEQETDLRVDRRFCLGGTMICHGALVHGEIDLYAEYTGTGLTAVLQRPPRADPQTVYEIVSAEYARAYGLAWLAPFGMNNAYAVTVRQADADRHGWERVSDLAPQAADLRAGWTGEFAERPDGYPGLCKAYDFQFGAVSDLDSGLMYEAIAKGEVDVIAAFATDGRIAAYGLKPLEDDRQFFPPYFAAPVVRQATLDRFPEIRNTLLRLGQCLDNQTMQRLNFAVDGQGRSPEDVARKFLESRGLIHGKPVNPNADTLEG